MSATVPASEPDVVVIADDDDGVEVIEMPAAKSKPVTATTSAVAAAAAPTASDEKEDDGIETDQEAESDHEEGWEDAPKPSMLLPKESDADEDDDKKSSDENGENASDKDGDDEDGEDAAVAPDSPESKPSAKSSKTATAAVVTEDRSAKLAALQKTAFKMPSRSKAKSKSDSDSSSSSSESSSKGKVDAKTSSSSKDKPKKPKKTDEEKKKEREEKDLLKKKKEAEKRKQEKEAKEKEDQERAAAREANTPAAQQYAQEVFRGARTRKAIYPPCVIQLTKVSGGLTLYGYLAEGCGPEIFIPLSEAGRFPNASDFPSSPFGRFGDCLLTGLPATPATPLGLDSAISVTGLSTRITEWCKYMNKHRPGKKGQKKETSFAKLHKPPYEEFAKICDELDLHRIKEEEKGFDYIRNTGELPKGYTFPAKFAIQTMFMVPPAPDTAAVDKKKKKQKKSKDSEDNDDKEEKTVTASPTKKRKQPEPSDSSSSSSSSSSAVPAIVTGVVQPTNMDVKHSPLANSVTPNHVDAVPDVVADEGDNGDSEDNPITPSPAKKSKKSEPVTSPAVSVQADEPDE